MPVTVKVPTQLRSATGGQAEIAVEAATVGEALEAVYSTYADFKSRVADENGLRRFVNVYVGGEDIRFTEGLETAVADGSEITVLPAVAGGR